MLTWKWAVRSFLISITLFVFFSFALVELYPFINFTSWQGWQWQDLLIFILFNVSICICIFSGLTIFLLIYKIPQINREDKQQKKWQRELDIYY